MPKPRDPSILTKQDYCAVCEAETEWRLHHVGKGKNGLPRTRWRCMDCHRRRNRRAP